jgi:hypothetical protein
MNRRGFLATLVAAAVAPFLPKPKPKYEHKAVGHTFVVQPKHEQAVMDLIEESTGRMSDEICSFNEVFGRKGT